MKQVLRRRKNWEQYHDQPIPKKNKLNRRSIYKPVMSCRYCSNWYIAKRTGYLDEDTEEESKKKRKSEGSRNCLFSHKEITLKTESCENFVFHHSFWCNKNEHWKYVIACIYSKENSDSMPIFRDCKKCKQGDIIKAFKAWENQTRIKEKEE